MTTQPEALRLANLLDNEVTPEGIERETAAELRRLHAENEALRRERDANLDTINVDNAIITRLRAQRDALLEALRRVMRHIPADAGGASLSDDMRRARAAIAKVEAQQ